MEIQINENEFELLVHLHENVAGCDSRFGLRSHEIQQVMGWDEKIFTHAATYLNQWGLISVDNWVGGTIIVRISLTGAGEAFVREIERRLPEKEGPSTGRRLTLAAAKQVGKSALTVATQILTEYGKIWLPGLSSHHHT